MKVLSFICKTVAIVLLPVAIAAMIATVLLVWLCQLVYRLFKKFELDECMFESAAMIVAIVALVYADIFELADDNEYEDYD